MSCNCPSTFYRVVSVQLHTTTKQSLYVKTVLLKYDEVTKFTVNRVNFTSHLNVSSVSDLSVDRLMTVNNCEDAGEHRHSAGPENISGCCRGVLREWKHSMMPSGTFPCTSCCPHVPQVHPPPPTFVIKCLEYLIMMSISAAVGVNHFTCQTVQISTIKAT